MVRMTAVFKYNAKRQWRNDFKLSKEKKKKPISLNSILVKIFFKKESEIKIFMSFLIFLFS